MKKGFSIVELLTVVLIVAILASILFPVLAKTTAQAQVTGCLSNMHQIYTAVMLYEGDLGDLPPGNLLDPALKRYYPVLLQCPAAPPGTPPAADYVYFGPPSRSSSSPAVQDVYKRWAACRDARGPQFPIIFDLNHEKTPAAMKSGAKFFIVTRMDGSTHKINFDWAFHQEFPNQSASLPCIDPPYWYMNF